MIGPGKRKKKKRGSICTHACALDALKTGLQCSIFYFFKTPQEDAGTSPSTPPLYKLYIHMDVPGSTSRKPSMHM